ncbi:MAG TPA: GGDEF domain-containing protein [Xanthobacteraceae bacterium]|jgi:hypothetical protein
MAPQGQFVVVADSPTPEVVEALQAAGAFRIVEANWVDAPSVLATVQPEGVVVAELPSDRARAAAQAQALADQLRGASGPFTPVVARMRDEGAPFLPNALPIAAKAPAERIAARLASALRIRTLHGTVLRRMQALASRGEQPPALADSDPLEDASVLVAGRGRSYLALSVAVGERVGLVGALSVESAVRALNARDVDGLVIGDGFSPRVVEALLTVLAGDTRFCDLPVAVLGYHPSTIEPFCPRLSNLERIAEGPRRLLERFLPFVRLHAFAERLKRMQQSLDAKGIIDPDTGLLAHEAFWRDLSRAVDDAEKRGVGLSIARFCFEGGDHRTGRDAARLLARLMRQVDFACRERDNSIFAVFTDTDLRTAHVVARRLASVLKNTTLAPAANGAAIESAVTLATLKPTDNVDSLIARVSGELATT